MKIRNIAFDLDDTLIPNSYKYNQAIWKCGLIVSQALGYRCPYATDLMKMHYEHDLEMVKTWHFNAGRFPTSWVTLYENLTAQLGIEPDPVVIKRLYETAVEFCAPPFAPLK